MYKSVDVFRVQAFASWPFCSINRLDQQLMAIETVEIIGQTQKNIPQKKWR